MTAPQNFLSYVRLAFRFPLIHSSTVIRKSSIICFHVLCFFLIVIRMSYVRLLFHVFLILKFRIFFHAGLLDPSRSAFWIYKYLYDFVIGTEAFVDIYSKNFYQYWVREKEIIYDVIKL